MVSKLFLRGLAAVRSQQSLVRTDLGCQPDHFAGAPGDLSLLLQLRPGPAARKHTRVHGLARSSAKVGAPERAFPARLQRLRLCIPWEPSHSQRHQPVGHGPVRVLQGPGRDACCYQRPCLLQVRRDPGFGLIAQPVRGSLREILPPRGPMVTIPRSTFADMTLRLIEPHREADGHVCLGIACRGCHSTRQGSRSQATTDQDGTGTFHCDTNSVGMILSLQRWLKPANMPAKAAPAHRLADYPQPHLGQGTDHGSRLVAQ